MRSTQIDENTLAPLRVLAALGAILFMVATAYVSLGSATERIDKLEARVEVLYKIDKRLSRIEDKLGIDARE